MTTHEDNLRDQPSTSTGGLTESRKRKAQKRVRKITHKYNFHDQLYSSTEGLTESVKYQPSTSTGGLTESMKQQPSTSTGDMDPTIFKKKIAADIEKYQLETGTGPPLPEEYKPVNLEPLILNPQCDVALAMAICNVKPERYHGNKLSEITFKLIHKIEESVEKLVQLEYVARGTSPSEVRDCHIKLMVQLLRCWDGSWYSWSYNSSPRLLVVTETTPLYVLGAVFSTIHTEIPVFIAVASKIMKYLCKFLIQICHEAGLKQNSLIYVNIEDIKDIYEGNLYMYVLNDLQEKSGCTGVITDNSGLTSALEAISKSSNSITVPWRFTQLCVHEKIIGNLKRMLGVRTEITEKGSLIFSDKRFLIKQPTVSECNTGATAEPMDQEENKECSTESEKATINVYTYSTTEELLKQLNTPYLSVWGSNKALAHTLALKTNADVIWINDYATFEGPPRAALSVYRLYYNSYRYTTEAIGQLLEPWRKASVSERFDKVIAALKKINENYQYDHNALIDNMLKWRSEDSLLHITEKTIGFGIQKEAGIIFGRVSDETQHQLQFLKAVVYGTAVIYDGYYKSFNNLTEFGIPVFKCDDTQSQIVQYPIVFERLKMVRTKF